MIVLIIVLLIFAGAVVASVLACFFDKRNKSKILKSDAPIAFGLLAGLAFALLTILSSLAIHLNVNIEGRHAEYEAERKVLAYRLENQEQHIVEDLELYSDILEFNSSVAYVRETADNPWIGLFVDKAWLGVEEIEL